jgi:hypothetical protein
MQLRILEQPPTKYISHTPDCKVVFLVIATTGIWTVLMRISVFVCIFKPKSSVTHVLALAHFLSQSGPTWQLICRGFGWTRAAANWASSLRASLSKLAHPISKQHASKRALCMVKPAPDCETDERRSGSRVALEVAGPIVADPGERSLDDRSYNVAKLGFEWSSVIERRGRRRQQLLVAVGPKQDKQHLRPLHPARPLGVRARNAHQSSNILTAHRQFDRMPPSCHHTNPRSANSKRGIHQQTASSTQAGFMESVV